MEDKRKIRIVNLDNTYRKGKYIYIKDEGKPPRYYKYDKGIDNTEKYYTYRYNNPKEFKEGTKLYNLFKKGKKLSDDDYRKVLKYLSSTSKNIKVSRNEFIKEFKSFTKLKPVSVKRKLRDDQGKPIKLRENRYKVITKEMPSDIPSQYVGYYHIEFRLGKGIIRKVIYGYSGLGDNFYLDIELIRKKAKANALNNFYNSIGKKGEVHGYNMLNENDGRILRFEIFKEFWISYIDYVQLLNERFSR